MTTPVRSRTEVLLEHEVTGPSCIPPAANALGNTAVKAEAPYHGGGTPSFLTNVSRGTAPDVVSPVMTPSTETLRATAVPAPLLLPNDCEVESQHGTDAQERTPSEPTAVTSTPSAVLREGFGGVGATAVPDSGDDRLIIEDSDDAWDGGQPSLRNGLLSDQANQLLAVEECIPTLKGPCYLDALMRSDPRVAFDYLHIGALRAVEEAEELPLSHSTKLQRWTLPRVTVVGPTASTEREQVFCVDRIHAAIARRSPLEVEETLVDGLLFDPARRQQYHDIVGDDVLHAVRSRGKHHGHKRLRVDDGEPS